VAELPRRAAQRDSKLVANLKAAKLIGIHAAGRPILLRARRGDRISIDFGRSAYVAFLALGCRVGHLSAFTAKPRMLTRLWTGVVSGPPARKSLSTFDCFVHWIFSSLSSGGKGPYRMPKVGQ